MTTELPNKCDLKGHVWIKILRSADGRKYGILNLETCDVCGARNPESLAVSQNKKP